MASTSGVASTDTRESLFWVSPQGVRYGIDWDQDTLAPLAIDPARAVQAPWPILRTFAAGPVISRANALLIRDTVAPRGPAAEVRRPPRTRRVSDVETGLCTRRAHRAAAGSPTRVLIQPPLELPEREPRNILLMIAAPALLVGILGTLLVMYSSGARSLQSGFFPLIGLVGFGALMFSGRFGPQPQGQLGRTGEAAPQLPASTR